MWHYLKIWSVSARYSLIRSMMFRFDFILWASVELMWMVVNLLLVTVIYAHTDSVAGWSKYEMLLLVGTSMLIQRLLMGFFWTSLAEMGRNIRTGHFDFFLAQPGNILFMATTRKLDPDGLVNSLVAMGVVVYSLRCLGLEPGFTTIALYLLMVLLGLAIHYGALVLITSLSFWITKAEGIEVGYFTLFGFSRIPSAAFKSIARLVFVWLLPVVVVSNAPAETLLHGFSPQLFFWLVGSAAFWLSLGVFVFHCGLRRYSSASS